MLSLLRSTVDCSDTTFRPPNDSLIFAPRKDLCGRNIVQLQSTVLCKMLNITAVSTAVYLALVVHHTFIHSYICIWHVYICTYVYTYLWACSTRLIGSGYLCIRMCTACHWYVAHSAVADLHMLVCVCMCMCVCLCAQEFKRELEEEHKRELALLEAKLSQQMKYKLKVLSSPLPPACMLVFSHEMSPRICHAHSAPPPGPRGTHHSDHGPRMQAVR